MQKSFFFFSWTSIQSFRIELQKKIANILRIKWDEIIAIKFEAERLDFLSDVAVAVVVVWASYCACQTSGPNKGRFFGHARQGTFFFQSFVISTRTCRLFRSLFSVFLKIDSLQVYAIGLTREFAKCKTVPTKTTSAGIHSLQKTSSMM